MAASFTLPTVLANLTAGNQPLSLIDSDLTTLRDPLLALNTFSNYYTDTGAANAYVITVSSPQTVSQAAGLRVQFIATNANTGASTLQINALAAKNIKNMDGTALGANQIPASSVVDVIYDGTQYLMISAFPGMYGTGTWTPVLTFATPGDLNIVYANRVALYTKIGRLVFVSCNLATSTFTWTTSSGNLQITGLPFAANSTTNYVVAGPISSAGLVTTGGTHVVTRILAGTSLITFAVTSAAGSQSSLTTGNTTTTINITTQFGLVYEAST